MLDTLRKNSKSTLTYLIFLGIIVVFVFSFGPGSEGCQSGAINRGGAGYAAKVNGEKIPISDFEQTYARRYREFQQRAGGQLPEELLASLSGQIKSSVMDELVQRELLAQAARDQGIKVSDQELAEQLGKMPAFQKDGQFDGEQYRLIVERQLGTTPALFEKEMRRSLMSQKLMAGLLASAKVSDDEVRADYIREKEKLDLEFVRFVPSSFESQVPAPSAEKIDAFLKENQARVQQAYDAAGGRFSSPERFTLRQIVVKGEGAKEKAEALKKKLDGGADFAATAKAESEDAATKEKGGELGTLAASEMTDPAVRDAALKLKAGEISQPVKTAGGYAIVKVDAVQPAAKRPLDEVKQELAKELIVDDEAKSLAKAKAEAALAQAKAGKPLAQLFPKPEEKADAKKPAAPVTGPVVEETGSFSPADEYIPRVGIDPALTSAALALTEDRKVADKVFELNGNFLVVALKSHERPNLEELAQKMDEYREKSRAMKGNQVLEGFLDGLKARATIEKNPAIVGPASAAGLESAAAGS